MKEIDWSKAPSWAGAVISSGHGVEYFVSQWGGRSVRRVVGLSSDDDTFADMTEPHEWSLVALRSPEWNGEGLPPVGTVCEARFSMECVGIDRQSEWVEIIPVAYGKNHIIYDHGGSELSAYLVGSNFRVIRTPEQIAADEREHSIRNACTAIARTLDQFRNDIACANAARAVVEALHDAGYRKQEQPK